MKYNIELIRFLAVILITFTHTRHEFTEGGFYFVIEELPKLGTVILSIISGYLYWNLSKDNPNLFQKKIKSLLVPFMIANLVVIVPVVVLNYFGYNFLNRLTYDYTIITEGLFSLNSPPINPPTFFVRDLFVVFALIELLMRRNWKALIILVPLIVFGKLMIRYDILVMFVLGILFANFDKKIDKRIAIPMLFILSIVVFYYQYDYARYFVSALLFVSLIDVNIKFINTGGYSYLLHLYHSPIMVFSYPLISMLIENIYWRVILQILVSLAIVFMFYRTTRKIQFLKVLTGGR